MVPPSETSELDKVKVCALALLTARTQAKANVANSEVFMRGPSVGKPTPFDWRSKHSMDSNDAWFDSTTGPIGFDSGEVSMGAAAPETRRNPRLPPLRRVGNTGLRIRRGVISA